MDPCTDGRYLGERAEDDSVGRARGKEGQVRRARTVRRAKAGYGQQRAGKARDSGLPRAFETFGAREFPACDEAGAREQVVDMPVQTLCQPTVSVDPSARPTWAECASCVGVPAARQVERAQAAHLNARILPQVEKEQIGPRTVRRAAAGGAVARPEIGASATSISIGAVLAAGVDGSCDRSSLPGSVARSRGPRPSLSWSTAAPSQRLPARRSR